MPFRASVLFPQKLGIEIALEIVLIHVSYGQIGIRVHNDSVFVYFCYLGEIDYVGAVYAHEIVGQPLFHLLHREQRDYGFGFSFDIYLKILAHGLDIADAADVNLDNAVLGLEEDGSLSTDLSLIREGRSVGTEVTPLCGGG